MMILRRQVRKAFLGTSWVLAYFVFVLVKHPEWAELHGEVRYYGLLLACALLAVLYTAAVLTTSKPSPYRNNWAVAASSLSLILGFFQAYFFRSRPDNLRAELSSLVVILLGGAGLYFYAPGGSPAKPESEDQSANPAGSTQSTMETVSFPVRKIPTTPTALAPSLAAASSPELAAAASSPRDPNAPWDPLAFMRTPEILEKIRS
jgi:hypothetical protein